MPERTENEVIQAEVALFQKRVEALRSEIGKVVVGQRDVVDGAMVCMLAGSHALLEGVPGLGKTVLVKTIAEALALSFSRIQFTPDLMPADILGSTVIDESNSHARSLTFRKGPIFANIVLADEINRATPKTQSALLEAMQEHRVTVAKTTYPIPSPFFVLGTQNPLEMEGTYPLPEAQLDRFFMKLEVPFPSTEELHAILDRTTGGEPTEVRPVLSADELLSMQRLARQVPVARHVQAYVIRILEGTHPEHPSAPATAKRFVRFGASPRGAQSMLLAAKIYALFDGRYAPSIEDVRRAAVPALRHRVLLNFEGEAEGVKTDEILRDILELSDAG